MRILIACLLVLLPTFTWATPPRVVFVDEKLFAVNSTHIFIMRTLSDNFGYYDVNQTDLTLIARNRETGQDDQHWPVLSIRDRGATFAEFEPNEDRVANLGLAERANPYDIVLWRKARLPLNNGAIYDPSKFSVAAGVVSYTDFNETTYTARLPEAQLILIESLKTSRVTIPFNPGAGPSTDVIEAAKDDPLFDWPRTFGDHCSVTENHSIETPAHAQTRQFAAKLTCRDDEEAFAAFVILNTLPEN